MFDIDNMSFDEIEKQFNEFLVSPEFDQMSRDFFSDLLAPKDRPNFKNTWNLNKNAEKFIYWSWYKTWIFYLH